jgi:hypothetical protein
MITAHARASLTPYGEVPNGVSIGTYTLRTFSKCNSYPMFPDHLSLTSILPCSTKGSNCMLSIFGLLDFFLGGRAYTQSLAV